MSMWAYRKCKNCGKDVHINFRCSCGGNPWNIQEKEKENIKLIDLEKLKKKLNRMEKDILEPDKLYIHITEMQQMVRLAEKE